MRLEYTEQAQEVLAVMEETAHQMKFSYIGTEHLLYGKLSVGDCVEDSRGEWGRRILCFKISGTKQWNEEDKDTCVFR